MGDAMHQDFINQHLECTVVSSFILKLYSTSVERQLFSDKVSRCYLELLSLHIIACQVKRFYSPARQLKLYKPFLHIRALNGLRSVSSLGFKHIQLKRYLDVGPEGAETGVLSFLLRNRNVYKTKEAKVFSLEKQLKTHRFKSQI